MTITVKNRWWEVYPRVHKIYDNNNLVAAVERIDFGNESETFLIEDGDGNKLATLTVVLRTDMTANKGESPFTLSINKKRIKGKFVNLEGHTSFKFDGKEYLIRWPEPKHPRENMQYLEVINGDNVVARATMDIRTTWERHVEIGDELEELRIPLALVLARKVGFVGSEYVHYF
ncbi:MAG: hypothetical protein ACE5G7_03515 [Candidatus Hydrothermarchaeaceae archaeon]